LKKGCPGAGSVRTYFEVRRMTNGRPRTQNTYQRSREARVAEIGERDGVGTLSGIVREKRHEMRQGGAMSDGPIVERVSSSERT